MFTPFARAVPWCSGQWCFIVAALVGLRAAFRYRGVRLMAAAGLAGMVAACALPEHMQVRSGIDPRNQDDDVRFRTTYYFRVFDACLEIEPPSDEDLKKVFDETGQPFYSKTRGRYKLLSDSLYRFRMTGKANPLFSAVHFESGTLRASEIEPFGASVAFDEKSRRFRFVSRKETETRIKREAIYREIHRLKRLATNLDSEGDKTATEAKTALRSGIKKRIMELFGELTILSGISVGIDKSSSPGTGNKKENDKLECLKNTVKRRGFQILGPEGWRTFNQDERLLLAMTISGKPLISAMKDLSSRVLNAQPDTTGMLLTLARERIRISEAKSALLGVDKDLIAPREGKQPPTIKEIVDAVTAAFGKGEGGK